MIDPHHGWNRSFKPLIAGFVLSVAWVLIAYFFAIGLSLSKAIFPLVVILFAPGKAITQFIFFFHIGVEEKPRWNLMILLFMALVVFVLVGGTLWIMRNLNYNVMPSLSG